MWVQPTQCVPAASWLNRSNTVTNKDFKIGPHKKLLPRAQVGTKMPQPGSAAKKTKTKTEMKEGPFVTDLMTLKKNEDIKNKLIAIKKFRSCKKFLENIFHPNRHRNRKKL